MHLRASMDIGGMWCKKTSPINKSQKVVSRICKRLNKQRTQSKHRKNKKAKKLRQRTCHEKKHISVTDNLKKKSWRFIFQKQIKEKKK